MSLSSLSSIRFHEIFRHSSLYVGLAMAAVLWLGITFLIETERKASRAAVEQETANLARVFEENLIRSITTVDAMLLQLRRAGHDKARTPDWHDLVKRALVQRDFTIQLAVIDRHGRLVASSSGPQPPAPVDLSDREHFKAHVHAPVDRLFISKPVLGRVTNRWTVQLTRRITTPAGDFDGVIVASIDPEYLARFYGTIELGSGGAIAVVGEDGLVRASDGEAGFTFGQRLAAPALSVALRETDSGTVLLPGSSAEQARIASYRWIRGYPLAVIVATHEVQPDSAWLRNRPFYLASGAALTALLAWAVIAGLLHGLDLQRLTEQISRKSSELRVTLENMSQGIAFVDAGGHIRVLNNRFAELLELRDPEAWLNRPSDELTQMLIARGEYGSSRRSDDPDEPRIASARLEVPVYERTRPDGTVLEVRTTLLPGGGFVRTLTDISGRRRDEARILQLARHDALTNLVNRNVFRQMLGEAIEQLGSTGELAVHIVDLDRFKSVNDTYGHQVGDKLLKAVAERLRASVRGGDVVARLGGDEFAVIQIRTSGQSSARALAARICEQLSRPYEVEGHHLVIGASIGIAFAPADATSVQDILHCADLALYAAKSGGRGCFELFRPQLREGYMARQALEADLRKAIALRQFELHYQPILSVETGHITAYEALLRWRHPERGLVAPLSFIPLAEESGLIVPIGAFVIETACREIASRPGDHRIALNLSPVQFRDPNLIATVRNALAGSGLAPHRLEIEITESALLHDDQLTHDHLRALCDLGAKITMDDFGTGYSSLGYLLSYPIQAIKIDRSFVKGIGEDASSRAIVRAITTLATSLGLSTTAEGVETADQLSRLAELGCTEAQGFLFSKPMPAADILPAAAGEAPDGETLQVAAA